MPPKFTSYEHNIWAFALANALVRLPLPIASIGVKMTAEFIVREVNLHGVLGFRSVAEKHQHDIDSNQLKHGIICFKKSLETINIVAEKITALKHYSKDESRTLAFDKWFTWFIVTSAFI